MRAPVLYHPETGKNNALPGAPGSSQANTLSSSSSSTNQQKQQPQMAAAIHKSLEEASQPHCPEAQATGAGGSSAINSSSSAAIAGAGGQRAALKLSQQPARHASGKPSQIRNQPAPSGWPDSQRGVQTFAGSALCDAFDCDDEAELEEPEEELSECSCSNSLECMSQQQGRRQQTPQHLRLQQVPPQQVSQQRHPHHLELHHNSFPLAHESHHDHQQLHGQRRFQQPPARPYELGRRPHQAQQQQQHYLALQGHHFRRPVIANSSMPLQGGEQMQQGLPLPPPPPTPPLLVRQNTYTATPETITDASFPAQAHYPGRHATWQGSPKQQYQAATLGRQTSAGSEQTLQRQTVSFRRSATNVHEQEPGKTTTAGAGSESLECQEKPGGSPRAKQYTSLARDSAGRRRQAASGQHQDSAASAEQTPQNQPAPSQLQHPAGHLAPAGVATYPPASPLAFRLPAGSGDARHLLAGAAAAQAFDAFALPAITSHRSNSPWMRISSIILTPIGIFIILFIVVSPLLHYLF